MFVGACVQANIFAASASERSSGRRVNIGEKFVKEPRKDACIYMGKLFQTSTLEMHLPYEVEVVCIED